ncbi:MAG: mechanosensitive ion channel family protein [Oxalicibacterium faecigallinarum]|uniref:Mechanosensitive ion channel protein MscS n=1 Tax=Oxalicibacterium faecigallinarum TaxID=573741 RepID=A0A8J3F3M3_9BURK|nr:mechanosensitive ion channel family protein [Oxalicibacterium faecigallinarum]MDQ7968113.1 mechanosensitive ion channel family protein [Oxalicibacterium faecigallinarum]GGI19404.1 mechanosensitive ion channel protein MscS [Oxalicibacterium faecigallinarum]
MHLLNDWLLAGIPLGNWLNAVIIATLAYLAMDLVTRFLTRRLTVLSSRTSSRIDNIAADALSHTKRWLLFLLAIVIGLGTLSLPEKIDLRLSQLGVILVGIQIAIWFNSGISAWMRSVVNPETTPDLRNRATTTTIAFLVRLLVLVTILLAVLANLGVNITAFVASLGIGGVAVALALQTILSDLFASLSIAFDKPFEVGDFIIVDEVMLGTVEYIGIKTTRLRSLGGEQLVRSNAELLKSVIRNYKRMSERRVVFSFGIRYETPIEQVGALGGVMKEIITGIENTRFDRAHFQKFGPSSLDFEVVYIVLSSDFNVYMDIQQKINLALMRACAERDIHFARPTTIMHLGSEVRVSTAENPGAAKTDELPEGSKLV